MEFTQVEVNVMIRFEKDVSGNMHIAEFPITYAYNAGTGSIKFYYDNDQNGVIESAIDSFLKWYAPSKIEEGIEKAVKKKKEHYANIFKNKMNNCRTKYTMLCLLLPF